MVAYWLLARVEVPKCPSPVVEQGVEESILHPTMVLRMLQTCLENNVVNKF